MEVRCLNRWGLLADILRALSGAGLEALEFRVHAVQGAEGEDVVAYEVRGGGRMGFGRRTRGNEPWPDGSERRGCCRRM